MRMSDLQKIGEGISWDPDLSKVDYNRVLLDHFFSSMTGKMKVLNDFLKRQPKNPRMRNP